MSETLDYDHFRTTNQSYHEFLETQDFSTVKKNFRKKTPFTQWSNAYFSGGVFFNPPVSGIWASSPAWRDLSISFEDDLHQVKRNRLSRRS